MQEMTTCLTGLKHSSYTWSLWPWTAGVLGVPGLWWGWQIRPIRECEMSPLSIQLEWRIQLASLGDSSGLVISMYVREFSGTDTSIVSKLFYTHTHTHKHTHVHAYPYLSIDLSLHILYICMYLYMSVSQSELVWVGLWSRVWGWGGIK